MYCSIVSDLCGRSANQRIQRISRNKGFSQNKKESVESTWTGGNKVFLFFIWFHIWLFPCVLCTPKPIACQYTLASDCPLVVDMMSRLLRNIFAWKLFTNIFGCFFEANCLRSSRPKCTWVEAWIVPRSLDNMAISSPKIQQGTISNSSQSNEVKKCIVAFSSFYFIFSIFFAAGGGNIFFGSGISWKL